MAGNIKGITIEIGGNTTPLQKALSGVNKSIKDTQKQLKEVDKLLKVDPKNVELLRQKQDLLNKAVSDTKDKLDKEKEALKKLAAQDQTPEVTEKMNQLKRAIAEDEQALKSANKELKQFGSVGKQEAMATAKQFEETGKKIQEVGKKISDVGQGLTTHVTAPIVAVGGASLAAFNEVDKGYDIVIQKTGAVGASAQGMYDIVDQLATSIPTDFETAGNAVGEVNTRFGLTGDALYDLSEQFIQFAKLNNTDVTSSVDSVQKALSAFGLDSDHADTLLNRLNKTGQETGVSVETLTSGLIQNGTAFQEMGLNIYQSTALMGQLEKSGANSETVMQGLRKALKNAAKDGKPLNQALDELQSTIESDEDGMKGLNAAYELFGKSGDQIYGAVKNGSLDFRELGSTMSDASGSVSKTFETTLSPMDEWKMTLNELKLAGADLGATLGEILLPIIQKAGDVVQSLREKWESLSPEQQKMIEQIALIVAVVGPVVSLIGSLIMGIGGLISSIGIITGALGISAAAFGGIVVAIAAVIAIIVVCITHWDQIKAKVQEVWTAISTYMSNLKDDIAKKWNDIKQNIAEKIQSIKTDLQEKWSQIKSDAIQKITDMKNDAIQKFVDLKDGIKKKIEDIKGFFTGLTLKFPKIEMPKLPHFSLEGEFSLNPPSVPHLSVDWYAKAMGNPYLFTSPTIVGAGEAGAEVMYGRDNLMKDISAATSANNDALIDGIYVAFSTALRQADLTVEINEREFGRIVREARL
jgi:TP901 family phage tail tape measure protein